MLYITKGLPASGKSTWAYNSGHIVLELDNLRKEFPGKGEKEIKQIRDKRLLSLLRQDKTVVCSDTNLSSKAMRRLISIAKQAKSKIQIIDFTNVPLEVCLERDKQRKDQVGPRVMMKFYSQIRDDLEPQKEDNYYFVGDIHGDYSKMKNIIKRNYDRKPIFLGDINDPRKTNNEGMSSWKCLCLAKELHENGEGILLRSNHQLNLINWYYGLKRVINKHTTEEFLRQDKTRQNEMILFLQTLPYYYQFYCHNLLFTGVHAFWSYGMKQFNPKHDDIQKMLFDRDNIYNFNYPGILVCGHYHEVGILRDKQDQIKKVLLDGGCGNDGGSLYSFFPKNWEFVKE